MIPMLVEEILPSFDGWELVGASTTRGEFRAVPWDEAAKPAERDISIYLFSAPLMHI